MLKLHHGAQRTRVDVLDSTTPIKGDNPREPEQLYIHWRDGSSAVCGMNVINILEYSENVQKSRSSRPFYLHGLV